MQQYPLWLLITVFAAYMAAMFAVSRLTSRKLTAKSFFSGDRKAPWAVVAYGMVGTVISGVTFVSVPGNVMKQNFYYMPLVFGFVVGYIIIAKVLLPLYYRMNITSIYAYLGIRFGERTHKTGSAVFLVSRVLGAAVRIFVVTLVLYTFVPKGGEWQAHSALDISVFALVTFVFLAVLYLYTYRGGVKTVIWTDVLQTTFMLLAVLMTIIFVCQKMDWGFADMVSAVANGKNPNIEGTHFCDLVDMRWDSATNIFKQLVAGVFISIAITGLDQSMMQKSLACADIKSAQKNFYSSSAIQIAVNYFFLLLGALLCMYVDKIGGMEALGITKTDEIFPAVASRYMGLFAGTFFLVGLISASYPSAANALTSLTTSFCVDFLKFETRGDISEGKKVVLRNLVHAGFATLFFLLIVFFYVASNDAVINLVYKLASYTYGPLLGFFLFGIFTKRPIRDGAAPYIAVAAPVLCFAINEGLRAGLGFDLGFTLLIVNGALTCLALWVCGIGANPKQGAA
ncbi:MAG: sodium:solute symporter [Opitutales bacterium]|nr:sodium:solute symporter [Opitutales bacterium]